MKCYAFAIWYVLTLSAVPTGNPMYASKISGHLGYIEATEFYSKVVYFISSPYIYKEIPDYSVPPARKLEMPATGCLGRSA